MKKRIIIIVLVVVLAAAGIFFYGRYRSAQNAKAQLANLETTKVEMGNLTATISAIGKVRSRQSANLIWETSGTVEEVKVTEGQEVKAGDILATLKQTSLLQNVILAQSDLASAQQALGDLNTQAETARIQAMQQIVTYEKAVRDAQYQLDNFTVPTSQANLDTVEALKVTKAKLDQARAAWEPYKYSSYENSTRQDLKTALDEAQADYNAAVKRLQYEYDLEVAQSNLNKAQMDYAKWKGGPLSADVEAAKARIAATEATLNMARIEAPFDGKVSQVAPQVGDQVTAGLMAFRVDNLSAMYVDLEVSEIDITQVKIGQDVVLKLDAIRSKEYHGKVTEVALASVGTSDLVNYTVTIELSDADGAVRPGMTSDVEIAVATLQNVLLVPNLSISDQNGLKTVYALGSDQVPVLITVTVGVSNATFSEILSGDLQAGDLVVMNPSAMNSSSMFGGPPPGAERIMNRQQQSGDVAQP